MHPLIAAHLRLANLINIEPRTWGLYWPTWQRLYTEELHFIHELTYGPR